MEDNEIKQKFEEIYKSKIEPNVRKLEPYRQEQKKKYDSCMKVLLICILSAIGGFALIPLGDKINNHQLMIIGAICFVGFYIVAVIAGNIQHKVENQYRQTVKPQLLKPILSIFGDFRLAKREILSLKEIQSMGLYYKARSKKDDDVIWGTYKDLPITLFETKLTHSESRGKSSSTVTDFSGLVIKVKVNKRFTGTTIASQELTGDKYIKIIKEMAKSHPDLFPPAYIKIIDNGFFNALGEFDKFMTKKKLQLRNGKLYIPLSFATNNTKNKANKDLEIVHVEDPEFDSNYNIYSDNQVEARYLITPSFIEKIKCMQLAFLVFSIDFAFKDEFLYLFLNGSDFALNQIKTQKVVKKNKNKVVSSEENGFFEVGSIQTTLSDKEIFKDIFNELSSIFSLVDCLKLNDNIGL